MKAIAIAAAYFGIGATFVLVVAYLAIYAVFLGTAGAATAAVTRFSIEHLLLAVVGLTAVLGFLVGIAAFRVIYPPRRAFVRGAFAATLFMIILVILVGWLSSEIMNLKSFVTVFLPVAFLCGTGTALGRESANAS